MSAQKYFVQYRLLSGSSALPLGLDALHLAEHPAEERAQLVEIIDHHTGVAVAQGAAGVEGMAQTCKSSRKSTLGGLVISIGVPGLHPDRCV